MITRRVEKEAINSDLLDQELKTALPGLVHGFSSQTPYPGWLDLFMNETITLGQQDTALAIIAAHAHTAQTAGQQTIALVKSIAQGAVGVRLTALTDNQKDALLACLLWRAGAIQADATIAPLGQWVR